MSTLTLGSALYARGASMMQQPILDYYNLYPFLVLLGPTSSWTLLMAYQSLNYYGSGRQINQEWPFHLSQLFLHNIISSPNLPGFLPLSTLLISILTFLVPKDQVYKLHVTLSTSTTYHPQSDGQTEVLNRTLETYLRCYCSNNQAYWSSYLPLAEWWYNTTFHSTIQITPYEVLYGQPPPLHLPYVSGEVADEEVDMSMLNRVVHRIGPVAYKLNSPSHVAIHPIFHVSQLKFCHEVPRNITHLSVVNVCSPYCVEPLVILDRRMIKKGNKEVKLLIQWKDMDVEQATCEDYSDMKIRFPDLFLEDKEVSKEGEMMQNKGNQESK
ncbi:hypothetical protein KY284_005102 [Solanum tuberosum]|nr:hypothetical protein KY284_005102 [Solanum tuberosum]